MEPFFFEKIFCFVENGVNGPFWGPESTLFLTFLLELSLLGFPEIVPDERNPKVTVPVFQGKFLLSPNLGKQVIFGPKIKFEFFSKSVH